MREDARRVARRFVGADSGDVVIFSEGHTGRHALFQLVDLLHMRRREGSRHALPGNASPVVFVNSQDAADGARSCAS